MLQYYIGATADKKLFSKIFSPNTVVRKKLDHSNLAIMVGKKKGKKNGSKTLSSNLNAHVEKFELDCTKVFFIHFFTLYHPKLTKRGN